MLSVKNIELQQYQAEVDELAAELLDTQKLCNELAGKCSEWERLSEEWTTERVEWQTLCKTLRESLQLEMDQHIQIIATLLEQVKVDQAKSKKELHELQEKMQEMKKKSKTLQQKIRRRDAEVAELKLKASQAKQSAVQLNASSESKSHLLFFINSLPQFIWEKHDYEHPRYRNIE